MQQDHEHILEQGTPPAFASTGPQGHRSRMRTRLLAAPGALADYEILEMLLFLGIPRRDTKPQAKGLINQFGSLAGALTAAADTLVAAGMPPRAAAAFPVVIDAAAQLAKAERVERVLLNDWDALDSYLLRPRPRPEGFSVLLLNNRNHLLAEMRLDENDPPTITRSVLKHALSHHATALILLRTAPTAAATPLDHTLLAHVRTCAAELSVLVHDMVVLGNGRWVAVGAGRS